MAAEELQPKPLQLKKKPRGLSIEDLQPKGQDFQPTDLKAVKCAGVVYGQGVVVTLPQDIWALVRLGGYGKGLFSRSVPCHQHVPSCDEMKRLCRKRKAQAVSGEEMEASWKKRMRLHQKWRAGETHVVDTPSEVPTPAEGSSEADEDYQEFVLCLSTMKEEDPYFVEEYLQLGAEEAFYLAAEASVLSVESWNSETLTNHELWVHFCSLSERFCARYAAYKHYRAGNWVPKSGLKFGADFLLYKEGPLSYHSSFAIVVREEEESEARKHSALTWKEVISLNRVSESARKDLLVCHVTWPQGITKSEPCVERAHITNVLVKRWVPEKDR